MADLHFKLPIISEVETLSLPCILTVAIYIEVQIEKVYQTATTHLHRLSKLPIFFNKIQKLNALQITNSIC